jgi:subtilisin family serine protease
LSSQWGFYSPKPIVHSAIVDITESGGMGRDGKGCVVCFSAGNSHSSLHWPARYPEVIAVGGTDHHDVHWHYSNHGPELDIVAPCGGLELIDLPGGFQCTTDISGPYGVNNKGMPDVYGPVVDVNMDYRYFGGTSAACPVVAGVAALLLSVEPNLNSREVGHFLCRSSKDMGAPGRDDYYGWGRVDARAALDMVLSKRADLNDDWRVDLEDLVILIESWGTDDSLADIAPATNRDGFVDEQDLELLLRYWQVEIPEMDMMAG